MSHAVIEVEDLGKRYGGRPVLDGVSFTVAEGEIFGILGPNGAGKTTAVECVEGLRVPDTGTVRVLGMDPHAQGDRLRERIGVQLQETGLPGSIRVGEALELYSSFYREPRDLPGLLADWGLEDKRNVRYSKLSGGWRQRVHIALALVGRPRVAFLDELTTGLDPQARRDTWRLIRRVRESGVTVVLVSHFMDEVEELCDRVTVLDGGRVRATGTPAELIARVGGEHRMSFRPVDDLDPSLLTSLPGVTGVERDGRRVVVTGAGDFATAVTAALARDHVLVAELRIDRRTLDDAYPALTGRPLEV
ncbi:ABC transporter ATP-binding protein [Actinomadura kijaniata]|uniref:ABC-2 type transport system ATP-binding protein n=1 Tax=Actinomadura namibiensis TaxID=182080 RepID=A0A7W3QM88_ACTNM|nr:ABC transporter ATP-binding protein [Actinomadura namibiensis]MBA8952315.1 ABC-2 type transport system ATP-binding protein [Actinomadura namibiensis]